MELELELEFRQEREKFRLYEIYIEFFAYISVNSICLLQDKRITFKLIVDSILDFI